MHYSDSQTISLEKQAAQIDKLFNVDARASVHVYFDLAEAYLSRREFSRALATLEKGLQLDPANENMQVLVSQVLIRVGRKGDAYSRLSYLEKSAKSVRIRLYAAHIISSNHLRPPTAVPTRPELHDHVLYLVVLDPMPDFFIANIKNDIEQEFRFPVTVIDRTTALPTENMRGTWSRYLSGFIDRISASNSAAALGRFYGTIGIPSSGPVTDTQRERVLKAVIAQDPKAPHDQYDLLRYHFADQYDANRIFVTLRREFRAQLGTSRSLGLLAVTDKDIFAGQSRYLFALTEPGLSVMSLHRFIGPGTERDVAVRPAVTQSFSSVVQILGLTRADHLPCASAYPNSLEEMDQKRAYLCPGTLKQLAVKYRELEGESQGRHAAQ